MGSEQVLALIQQALDADPGGGLTVAQVLDERAHGRADFWVGEKSVAVCGMQRPLGLREYHVWLAAGDLDELRKMEAAATTYAIEQGCERIVVHGRKGWKRALGYEQSPTIRKEL